MHWLLSFSPLSYEWFADVSNLSGHLKMPDWNEAKISIRGMELPHFLPPTEAQQFS